MPDGDFQVVHFISGRIRIKARKLKGDPGLGDAIQQKFSTVPGVHSVTANPVTGSVLVLYDPDAMPSFADLFSLLDSAKELGLIPEEVTADQVLDWVTGRGNSGPSATGKSLSEMVEGLFGALDSGLNRLTGQTIDLKTFFPAFLVLLGVGSLLAARGGVPYWYDFLWYAFGSYTAFHPRRS